MKLFFYKLKLKSTHFHLLPPANEVCEGHVFTSVCLSGGEGVSATHPQDQKQTPPSLEADTPLPVQCMFGDMGNKRAVRTLLEYILVPN